MKRFKEKLGFLWKNYKGLVLAAVGAVIFCIMLILKSIPAFCEWWTRTISRGIVTGMGFLTGWLPFSFYELFLVAAIITLIVVVVFTVKFIVKKRKKALVRLLSTVLAVVVLCLDFYFASISFAYNREAIPLISYSVTNDGTLSMEEYADFCRILTDEFNAIAEAVERDEKGHLVNPYSAKELNELIKTAYKELEEYDGYFNDVTLNYKPMLFSRIMAEMGLLGVFFAPFGEPNVSQLTHPADMPSTVAHEIAHSKGVLRENEANLTAYYVLLRSDNVYLRYCGMFRVYHNLLGGLPLYGDAGHETYIEIADGLSPLIREDYAHRTQYYGQYTLLEEISEFFNDLYLKLSGSSNGTGSYSPTPPSFSQIPGESGEVEIVITAYSDVQAMVLAWIMENED